MNLLYTVTAYPPSVGGAQSYFHQLASRLHQVHGVRVAAHWNETRTDWLLGTTLKASRLPASYELDGVSVQLLSLTPLDRIRVAPLVLGYYLIKDQAIAGISERIVPHLEPMAENVDLIHNGRIGREPLSFASLQLARRRDIPFVLTPFHHPRWVGWNYRHYTRLYRQADAIIALTAAEKAILAEMDIPPERIFVTGMGPVLAETPDAASFQERHSLDGPIVLFLGQKYQYKGCAAMLQAAPLVWSRFPETHFVFIGPKTRYSRTLFRQYHDHRILELGIVDLAAKTDALAACDLFCMPSTQESFGAVFLEAWMLGKPVIGGEAPATRQVISEGVDGYVVPQKPAVLAERIIDLLDRPSACQEMGERGRQKTLLHYTWERLTAKTEAIYHEILGVHGREPGIA
jgi:glycosyltransferase involved in cell wall biosynthesis